LKETVSSDDGTLYKVLGKVSGCTTRVGYEWIYLWSNYLYRSQYAITLSALLQVFD